MNLEELARSINITHKRISLYLRKTMEDMILIGGWLYQVKQRLHHGEYEPWCNKHLIVKKRERCYYLQMYMNPEIAKKSRTVHEFAQAVTAAKKAVSIDQRQLEVIRACADLKPNHKNWQVHHADNRKFSWPDLDHIWTDPPWPQTLKELEHYIWLAGMAKAKLKVGGLLAIQCGAVDLPKIFPIFKDFNFITELDIVYKNSVATNYTFLTNHRPVLLFSKGKTVLPKGPVTDTVTVKRSAKTFHNWQQPPEPFLKWIPALTKPGDLIGDPFTCTGTIPFACKMTGRLAIATEIDAAMFAVARKRLFECEPGMDIPWGQMG